VYVRKYELLALLWRPREVLSRVDDPLRDGHAVVVQVRQLELRMKLLCLQLLNEPSERCVEERCREDDDAGEVQLDAVTASSRRQPRLRMRQDG